MKRLTIVIPGYNNKLEWWRRCLVSVVCAASSDDEIILVNDGSTDGTGDLLDGLAKEMMTSGRAIKVINKSNGGLASARNAALDIAEGRYIAFVDSDDEIKDDVFNRGIRYLEKTNTDICIFGLQVVWLNDGLCKSDVPRERNWGALNEQNVFELHNNCLLNYVCNKIYRRSFLGQLRFDLQGMPCEDLIFNLECIKRRATFCSIPVEGYVYYRRDGTLLSKYCASYDYGVRHANELWISLFGHAPTLGYDLDVYRWKNIWMPGSPYSFIDRWKWLKEQGNLGGVLTYIKMCMSVFARRYLYIRPVRRWNIKRNFPNVVYIAAKSGKYSKN